MKYKHLIFDLDGTLYDEYDYFKAVLENISAIIMNDNPHLKQTELYNDILADFYSKGTQYKNYFSHISQKYYGDDSRGRYFFSIYCNIEANLQLYPDFLQLVNVLKGEGILMSLLTNGTIEAQKNKIRILKLDQIFDYICVARELGDDWEKPNPDVYKRILDLHNVKTEDSMYIGDNPINDFQGAKELGITTVRLRRGEFKDLFENVNLIDYTIEHFSELLAIIKD